jgi:LysR family glycine cleavage system transcriptional activator
MPNIRHMPPLGWIRVFECAARHLNFRRAADELHVTPGAVSQQIKMLEESVGLPLFERRPHAMRLTPAGERLFPVATRAVHNIYDAVRALRSPRQVVRLTAAPTFCTRWLVPRLGSFYSQHPDIEISIDAAAGLVDLFNDPFDIAIRRVREMPSNFHVQRLFADDVVALCSPRMARLIDGDVANLKKTKLLIWSWQDYWSAWLEQAGGSRLEDYEQAQFSHLMLALEAAQAGQGVALTSPRLVRADLENGRLVHVLGPAVPSGYDFAVVARPDAIAAPHIRAFVDWTVRESMKPDDA